MHSAWPIGGIEDKCPQISDPRDNMRCARNCPAVKTGMDAELRTYRAQHNDEKNEKYEDYLA